MVKVYLERRVRMSIEVIGGILLGISITMLIFYLIRDIIISRLLNNLLEDSITNEDINEIDNIKFNKNLLVDEFRLNYRTLLIIKRAFQIINIGHVDYYVDKETLDMVLSHIDYIEHFMFDNNIPFEDIRNEYLDVELDVGVDLANDEYLHKINEEEKCKKD